jgi:hypothetical protein
MKKSGLFLILLLSMIPRLSAQSNELIDGLLDKDRAPYGDVVRLTLNAANLLPETATPEQALEVLKQQGWKVRILAADAPTPLGDYSFLLMKAFNLTGGVLYRLYPGPRYACRELGYLKAIPSDARPNRIVSGEEAIGILGNVMALKEGAQ